MSGMAIPQGLKPVLLFSGAANAVACDVIDCRNALKVWFLIFHAGANDTDLTLQLTEATDVAAGTNAAVTVPCPIWKDVDAGAASDTLAEQTEDDNLVIDPATQNPVLAVIEWDPSKHTDGYSCIYLADTGGNAANTIQIFGLVERSYASDTDRSVLGN